MRVIVRRSKSSTYKIYMLGHLSRRGKYKTVRVVTNQKKILRKKTLSHIKKNMNCST